VKVLKVIIFSFLSFITNFVLGGFEDENQTTFLEEQYRLNGIETQEAFGDSKRLAVKSTVRLIRNQKLIALGTIINADGYILTKASSCVGAREAQLANGEIFPLKIRKRYEDLDLALYQLQSDKNDFDFVSWDDSNQSLTHSWVLSSFTDLEEIRVGLASGKVREIGREGGVMGVILGGAGKRMGGVRINEVVPQAAADRAGLIAGDIIIKVDGRRVNLSEQVVKIVGSKDPGDLVNLEIKRNDKIKTFKVTLGHKSVTFDLFNRNLQMSGPVSKRKDNFPLILQHDLPLPKEAMGGPLFNITGQCVGINIARVDRVTIYTLPSKTVIPIIKDLIE
jgi:serine protease Do